MILRKMEKENKEKAWTKECPWSFNVVCWGTFLFAANSIRNRKRWLIKHNLSCIPPRQPANHTLMHTWSNVRAQIFNKSKQSIHKQMKHSQQSSNIYSQKYRPLSKIVKLYHQNWNKHFSELQIFQCMHKYFRYMLPPYCWKKKAFTPLMHNTV